MGGVVVVDFVVVIIHITFTIHIVEVVRRRSPHPHHLRPPMRLDANRVAEAGAVARNIVVVVVIVRVDIVLVFSVGGAVGRGAAAEADLDQGLQGREAGAGNAY